MAIPRFNEDLAIISKLGDNPGSDNNLTTYAFRAKFDEGPLKIQNYLNDVLIPAAEQSSSPQEGLSMQGGINMNGQKLNGLNAPIANDEAATKGYVDGALDEKMSMELLWENASPDSDFARQTIKMDMTGWDGFIIQTSENTAFVTNKIGVAGKDEVVLTGVARNSVDGSPSLGYRAFKCVADGISISNFYTSNWSTFNNKGNRPNYIYGIKGVSE